MAAETHAYRRTIERRAADPMEKQKNENETEHSESLDAFRFFFKTEICQDIQVVY